MATAIEPVIEFTMSFEISAPFDKISLATFVISVFAVFMTSTFIYFEINIPKWFVFKKFCKF